MVSLALSRGRRPPYPHALVGDCAWYDNDLCGRGRPRPGECAGSLCARWAVALLFPAKGLIEMKIRPVPRGVATRLRTALVRGCRRPAQERMGAEGMLMVGQHCFCTTLTFSLLRLANA
jgi:hypothetical protein